ncbi:MAG: polysaccharide biosynthesis protein [Gammaproteobacteria bacterium]|nr:polysaccharide biosynthesis protein [Gammaproteobacteria bacterium]
MRLARSILWNAAGIGLPLAVGVVVVPAIVRGLGTERFGFLSIVWMMIGYFSIFDLGLGRTLTKLVADRLGEDREREIGPLVSTTLIIVIVSGVLVSVATALSAGWLAQRTMSASPALVPEATSAILWLAASLPFVLVATVLTGLLEGYQRFVLLNAVRLPLGVLVLIAPLVTLPFSRNIGVVTAVIAGLRALNTAVLAWLTWRVVPSLGHEAFRFRRALVGPLLTYGGWLTVSNVVGPLMVYFDRFVIAAMLGSAAIAYYTVPYDVLNRLLLFPQAIQGVLFPNFALMRVQNSPRIVGVFSRASSTTLLLMTPPLLAIMLFAYQGLDLWVGPSFAQNSAQTARILMVGVVVNAMARTPFVFLQGAGYAKWTGTLHMLELPFYAVALWSLLRGGAGIEGAAYAWSGRIVIDAAALYVMTVRLEPQLLRTALRDLALVAVACLAAVGFDFTLQSTLVRVAALLVPSAACGAVLLSYFGGRRPELAKSGS